MIHLPIADLLSTENQLIHSWALPLWLTSLLTILVIAFAVLLYRYETGNSSTATRTILAILRAALLVLTLWMLAAYAIQPFRSERPELLLVVDASQSLQTLVETNSGGKTYSRFEQLREILLKDNADTLSKLNERYQLKLVFAGQQAKVQATDLPAILKSLNEISPDQPSSRLGSSLQQVLELQRGRPTSAILFISDGINTDGINLVEAATSLRAAGLPVFSIGVGTDKAEPDVQLADVMADSIVFVGDTIQIPYTLRLQEITAPSIKVQVRNADNKAVLSEQTLDSPSGQDMISGTLSFNAEQAGDLRITIEALPVPGEKLTENNSLPRMIEVRDQAIQVLLVQQTPSYEFRFLKSLLERARQPGSPDKPTFALTSILLEGDPRYADQDKSAERLLPVSFEQISKYDVIILGDVQANQVGLAALQGIERAVNQQGSGLIVIASDPDSYESIATSSLQRLLPVELRGDSPTAVSQMAEDSTFRWRLTPLGQTAPPLQLDSDANRNLAIWQQLPPLHYFIDVGVPKPGSLLWAVHPISMGRDSIPLLVSQYFGKGRVVVQGTDETFQWTSHFGEDVYYQRYWNQVIRWLARGRLSGSTSAKLSFDRTEYRTGDIVGLSLKFQGSVPLRDGERAEAILQLEGGQRQPISLESQGNDGSLYRVMIPNLTVGTYRAVLTQPSLQPPPAAEVKITPPVNELSKTRVDWKAMRSLAEITQGQFLPIAQWSQVADVLPAGKTIRLQPLPIVPLWNHWAVLTLFTVLISLEWLMRRLARML
jgi:hypothetical protein